MIKDKKIIIFIAVIVIIIIGSLYFISNKKYDYSNLLEYKDYDIVYDRINKSKDKVPYININNNLVISINNEIENMYQEYLLFSPDGFNYKYSLSKSILSIIIEAYVVHPESTHYDIIYKSYNIDLKEMKLLSNDEILERFNITEKKFEFYLYNKFLNYYNELIKNNYLNEKEIDFNTFLEDKNIDNMLDDNSFYINNNHLELYKYFNIYTDYNEQKFFNKDSFHFILT